jgi:hypothetical protein
MNEIEVDQMVKDYILKSGKDFRLSTTCSGPVILPLEVKPAKENDIKVKIGKNTLFISRVQARYIDRVTMDMMYDADVGLNCSLYPGL